MHVSPKETVQLVVLDRVSARRNCVRTIRNINSNARRDRNSVYSSFMTYNFTCTGVDVVTSALLYLRVEPWHHPT